MTCDAIRQLLLSLDLDEKSRRRVSEALAHLESCEACRHALQDFDRLAALLRLGEPDQLLPLDDGAADDLAGDRSLQLPDQSNVSPAGGWEAFEDKLRAAVRGQRPHLTRSHWWLPTLGGLAAMVMVGWGAYRLGKKASGLGEAHVVPATIVGSSHSKLVAAPLVPGDVAEKVRTFDAIDHSFEGRTRWLMFSGSSEAEVGLIDQCPQSPPTRGSGEKILLLRLNLVHGADVVSQADVLIVAGTTANVLVPTKLGQLQYHIVTSAVDPMRLRVQVQVTGEGGAGNTAGPNQHAPGMATAVLGTSLQLEPYHDINAGRLVLDRQGFDLQVAAAAAPSLPG